MHSSRMRTARLLTVSQHALPGGGCTCPGRGGVYLLQGVPAQGDTYPGGGVPCTRGAPAWGVYLPGGIPAQGVYLLGGCVPAQGVYLPGGVPIWEVPAQGVGVYLLGVYLPGGCQPLGNHGSAIGFYWGFDKLLE